MYYLIVKQKVRDFETWLSVFRSHEKAQKEAGLYDAQIYGDHLDLHRVICIFQIDAPEKARAFTQSTEADTARKESGMIGKPEVSILK